jgi:hypothetical protein
MIIIIILIENICVFVLDVIEFCVNWRVVIYNVTVSLRLHKNDCAAFLHIFLCVLQDSFKVVAELVFTHVKYLKYVYSRLFLMSKYEPERTYSAEWIYDLWLLYLVIYAGNAYSTVLWWTTKLFVSFSLCIGPPINFYNLSIIRNFEILPNIFFFNGEVVFIAFIHQSYRRRNECLL